MTEKTKLDNIIGIVKTEEQTDSIELKKEYYKSKMPEITIKCNAQKLTRQLNELFENNKLSSNPNEVKEFLKENLDVCALGSSDGIRVYLGLTNDVTDD